jgi:uncharacterized membrane protein
VDFTVSRNNIESFGILVLIVGAFLLLVSAIKGTYIIIAFIKGIPLYSISDIRVNVINVFFNFLIPFFGGLLLVVSGLTMLKYRNYTVRQSARNRLTKRFNVERSNLINSMLSADERKVLSILNSEGGILQSELPVKSGFSKVKVHRILKKLEGMNMIKRSRFGITNKVFINEA